MGHFYVSALKNMWADESKFLTWFCKAHLVTVSSTKPLILTAQFREHQYNVKKTM